MPDLPIISLNVTIYQNWNSIGWYHDYPTTAESLGDNITGCTLILLFEEETQTFLTHIVGTPWENFVIERGDGLFLYATEESVWQGIG